MKIILFIIAALVTLAGCGRKEHYLNVSVHDNSMRLPLPDNAQPIRRDFNRYDYFKLGTRYYCLGVVNVPNSAPTVFVFEVDEDVAYGRKAKEEAPR